ncbi:peroxiredoxin [Leifsonia xyli subsp. xyli]|uniref:ATP/GTP binding protein n=2 Tax=Leifsonia xyli subsp. xyli TaxID=59736 RepID=Q6ADZ3_LEIXX|nr:OsmC family protein [Leifsonia xyli]AAT89403.1 ATP/GTP binding protein [Leifsonia xyli subsp. xyli str. CTCB07]ODA90592.1 peroxiredoxin [Leifsonia xyli subsp. xyli]
MPVTNASTTVWSGDLMKGSGTVTLDSSNATSLSIHWKARSQGGAEVTTPEELLGAAHAACFSMAFSHALAGFGASPESVKTTAAVTFDPTEGITGSHLTVVATVPGISEEDFHSIAEEAKSSCPVSRALVGIPITLDASLA